MTPTLAWNIDKDSSDSPYVHIRLVILVIILGFVLRLFAYQHTYIINNDGTIYIHQARAIYYGLWSAVNSCTVNYLSLYPILVAATYGILGDWVASAEAVSIFFGTITLVPLYLLAKRFFEAKISILVTLIFALTPVFVTVSVWGARDPLYWFFSILGFYFFTGQMGRENSWGLFLSSISFILATFCRIEAIIYLVVSCLCLLTAKEEQKFRRLAFFLSPPLLLSLLLLVQMIVNPSGINWHRLTDIPSRSLTSLSQYQEVREHLKELTSHPPDGIPSGFFDNARTLVWLIALGTIMNNTVEAFFYPFFLIFIIGLIGAGTWKRISEEQDVRYFAILAASAVVVSYVYVFAYWEIENRYLALLILPSFIFMGFGLEKIIPFLKSRFRLKGHVALSLVVLTIMVSALPKDLSPKEADKLIFKKIGETIARIEGNSREIEVLSLGDPARRWVSFYANLHFKGVPPCPDKYYDYEKIVGDSYEQFIQNLKARDIRYVVWEEKRWPRQGFDFMRHMNSKDFIRLGSWNHPDTGRIILLKLL
jgi:4-amino-4-deoxy-L-arabinose transferase-like glycosyltransferase